ncbi:RidA family protein [Vagococcus sp.]|uniref:RidA family protein n=1 Tax=Vagococcus sp. TaxID=1933889 RepID=UPI003F9A4FCD
MKKTINSEKLNALGPYSHVVEAQGKTYYFSGQLGINAETKEMGRTIEEQTQNSLQNIDLLLKKCDLTKENVVKTTVLLADIQDFEAMNQVYGSYFTTDCPARSAFEVANLPAKGLVEIEVIAVKN